MEEFTEIEKMIIFLKLLSIPDEGKDIMEKIIKILQEIRKEGGK